MTDSIRAAQAAILAGLQKEMSIRCKSDGLERQNRRRAAKRAGRPEMCATLGVYIDDPGNAYTSPGPAEPVEGVRR